MFCYVKHNKSSLTRVVKEIQINEIHFASQVIENYWVNFMDRVINQHTFLATDAHHRNCQTVLMLWPSISISRLWCRKPCGHLGESLADTEVWEQYKVKETLQFSPQLYSFFFCGSSFSNFQPRITNQVPKSNLLVRRHLVSTWFLPTS